jgi:hypothetical protein
MPVVQKAMNIKWDGRTIRVKNDTMSAGFEANWHGYIIRVTPAEWWHGKFNVLCTDPAGGIVLRGAGYGTIRESVQDCFDRIDKPLIRGGDNADS